MKRSKILVVWPEEEYVMFMHTKIPKRWAYLGEIVTYLDKKFPERIKVMDCLDPRYSNGEVLKEIASGQYNLVIMVSRFESMPTLVRLSKLIKEIDDKVKILTYGDVCSLTPNFYKRESGVDAVILCGDWEIGISDYINFLDGKIVLAKVRGVEFKNKNKWVKFRKGGYLDKNGWTFSNIDSGLFSLDVYNQLTRDEVTISVSRGCPFNCKFCSAVATFGLNDRRKDIPEIIKYIKDNKKKVKSFKFFSPTLTCDPDWVKKLCEEIIKERLNIRWCGTTRTDQLDDEEMVGLMAKSGCYKIAVGVETLDKQSKKELNKHSGDYAPQVEKAVKLLRKYDIAVTALMMLGIRGQTAKNIKNSYERLVEWGASIRSTAYSPREILKEMDSENKVKIEDITKFDKMTYVNYKIPGINQSQFLKLIYNTQDFKNILE